MKNKSLWNNYHNDKTFDKLQCDLETDILIIGGGITGISCLYHLKDSNLKITLVEKNKLYSGITRNTTGKLTFLQENIYSKITRYHSKETAKLYLQSQKDAIDLVKEIIDKNKIDCNLENVNSYVFTDSFKDNYKLLKEFNLLKEFDSNIKLVNKLPDGYKVYNAIATTKNDTYVFNPIKYLNGLLKVCNNENIDIYENTNILSINKDKEFYICKTKDNSIKAKKVVLTLHYPYFLIPFFIPFKTYIEKSYIKANQIKDSNKFSAINISKPTKSIRYHEDGNLYKFFLTSSHNTSIKNNDVANFNKLTDLDNADYIWSNHDIITNDYLPFIGSLNRDKTLLIATGYNTWGMTNGSIAGKIISDIILKKDNKYINLFDPKRKINIGKIINFPLIIITNMLSFVKSKLNKNKSWYSNKVYFYKFKGKNLAKYVDSKGKEHIVYNKCPHLKCSLLFNEIEKTWDCPCHGSRFDIDGKVIFGPSNYDISYKDNN